MASSSLTELLRLLHAGFRVETITTRLQPRGPDASDATTHIEVLLKKGSIQRELESDEADFCEYCHRLHRSLDSDGNVVFRPFLDSNQYWNTSMALGEGYEERRKAAIERLRRGEFRFDYSPKALLVDCLKTREWGAERFLPLRRDHWEIEAAVLLDHHRLTQVRNKAYETHPKARRYGALVEKALDDAWQREDTFLKRCIRYLDYASLNLEDAAQRLSQQRKIVEAEYRRVAPETPTEAVHVLPVFLDAYRRHAEAVWPLIRALSDAAQVAQGRRPHEKTLGYGKRVQRLRESPYGESVDCLDPDIRHSESHCGTIIDDANGSVILTEEAEAGVRRVIRSYSYSAFAEIAANLENGLLVALFGEFVVHESALLVAVVFSREYFDLLLSIGNLGANDFLRRPRR
jgi:hypothetical protein